MDKNKLNNIREIFTESTIDLRALGKYVYYGLQDQIYNHSSIEEDEE